MRVILTQDVEKLGQAMDVVTVADGFARNYLLPRSLAMAATKSSLASLENLRKQEDRRQDKLRGGAQEMADKLNGVTLDYAEANVGSGGRLYGSIGPNDIAQMLQERFGVEIDKRNVLLQDPIRAEGFYTVPLKFHRDITVELPMKVGNPAPPVVAATPAPAEDADNNSGAAKIPPRREELPTPPPAEANAAATLAAGAPPVETIEESSDSPTPGVE